MDDSESQQKLAVLLKQFGEGTLDRRSFLRAVRTLGITMGVAEALAACGIRPTATPYPTAYEPVSDDPTMVAVGIKALTQRAPVSSGPSTGGQPGKAATSELSKKVNWFCVACGRQFPALEDLQSHELEYHSKRLPEIRRVDQPTYAPFITGPIPRFDEGNTAFSRSIWDQVYVTKINQAVEKFKVKVAGYTAAEKIALMEGQALVAGAIFVDDAAGSFHEKYTGYTGHMSGVGGLYGWEDKVAPTQMPVDDPVKMSARIKDVAKFFGASLVGITSVNPNWIYSNSFERASGKIGSVEMPYENVIVMAVEMGWDEINQSPGYPASAAAALGYSRMAELAGSLARYIRMLGYPALPSGNDTGQNIPLAIDAGLGEHGRSGLLLTPEFGPRQRLCKVFTSLPLKLDKPIDFGIVKYCETCHACAMACPAKVIPKDDRTDVPISICNRTGIKKWTVDTATCLLFWRENGTDCANCISACPWAMRSTRDWLES